MMPESWLPAMCAAWLVCVSTRSVRSGSNPYPGED
jgi:hypothetical protein